MTRTEEVSGIARQVPCCLPADRPNENEMLHAIDRHQGRGRLGQRLLNRAQVVVAASSKLSATVPDSSAAIEAEGYSGMVQPSSCTEAAGASAVLAADRPTAGGV